MLSRWVSPHLLVGTEYITGHVLLKPYVFEPNIYESRINDRFTEAYVFKKQAIKQAYF